MVTAVNHIKNSLGIDLALPPERQCLDQLLPGFPSPAAQAQTKGQEARYLEAVYDTVVGVQGASGSGFDHEPWQSGRIGVGQLQRLVTLAQALKTRSDTPEEHKRVLEKIADAGDAYIKILSAQRHLLKKDPDKLGNRHTLIRTAAGRIFEMTNSMTLQEVKRFKQKTGMIMNAVENAKQHEKNGKTHLKIELGAGGFAKTRIARDIESDEYLAVRKAHPVLKASVTHGFVPKKQGPSKFYTLDKNHQWNLRSISNTTAVPVDECEVASTQSEVLALLARSLRQPMSSLDLATAIVTTFHPAVDAAFSELNAEDARTFMERRRTSAFETPSGYAKTRYTFSELGAESVDALIERFNVMRSYFEPDTDHSGLSAEAINMLGRHSKKYDEVRSDLPNESAIDTYHECAGMAHFQSDEFKLKDPEFNRRFVNTLGMKVLSALAALNDGGYSHGDIKPDNIVLCHDAEGHVAVKLIDLDTLKPISPERALPESGCLPFMPPEACLPERDGSISYLGVKGDAYAMGLTLRKLFGYGNRDIDGIGQMHKAKALLDRKESKGKAKTEEDIATIKEIQELLEQIKLADDNHVQNQLRIAAIMKAAPEALTLKDVSDLMLKEHPGKRLTASEALECRFFKRQENLLSDKEFSAHVLRILRFGTVTRPDEIALINDKREDSTGNLAKLRKKSSHALMKSQRPGAGAGSSTGLTRQETDHVNKAEAGLQAQATVRRAERRLAGLLRAKPSIADLKLQYPKR